jgi:hypothetical protein
MMAVVLWLFRVIVLHISVLSGLVRVYLESRSRDSMVMGIGTSGDRHSMRRREIKPFVLSLARLGEYPSAICIPPPPSSYMVSNKTMKILSTSAASPSDACSHDRRARARTLTGTSVLP